MLNKYPGLFSDGVGTIAGPKVRIHVSADAQPLFHKTRTVPYVMRSMTECELDHLQSEVIISPVEYADWAAPIVPILKPHGTVRICGDHKKMINRYSKLDGCTFLKAEDLFTPLMGGQTFTKLDLTNAYAQMELDDDPKLYTYINTHRDLSMCNRFPFGIRSAAPISQCKMEILLKTVRKTVVFQDNILVTGKSQHEHLENGNEVLNRLSQAGLLLRHEKCTWMARKVEYLGHQI